MSDHQEWQQFLVKMQVELAVSLPEPAWAYSAAMAAVPSPWAQPAVARPRAMGSLNLPLLSSGCRAGWSSEPQLHAQAETHKSLQPQCRQVCKHLQAVRSLMWFMVSYRQHLQSHQKQGPCPTLAKLAPRRPVRDTPAAAMAVGAPSV